MVNRVAASNISLSLKTVGIVCVVSFFIDFVILMLDFSINNKQVEISLATNLVDRGIVPLIGIVLLLVAYWVDQVDAGNERFKGIDFRFPAFVLAGFLGVMFLIIFPWHINNVGQASKQAVEQINKDAQQAENQLNTQLSQFQSQMNNEQARKQLEQVRSQAKNQFTELIKDDQKYKQAIDNAQPEQKELLKKFKEHPEEIDKFIIQKTDPTQVAGQKRTQIRQRKEEAEKQAQQNAWRSGLRIGITSLLYAIAYLIIGSTGLISLGVLRGSKRKQPVR